MRCMCTDDLGEAEALLCCAIIHVDNLGLEVEPCQLS
jgi:hypothetical protein